MLKMFGPYDHENKFNLGQNDVIMGHVCVKYMNNYTCVRKSTCNANTEVDTWYSIYKYISFRIFEWNVDTGFFWIIFSFWFTLTS